MVNPGSSKYMFLAAAFTLLFLNLGSLTGTAQTQPGAQPAKVREVEFTYQTDLTGIDPKAHRVVAWIPLPREDRFQQVSAVSIESPAHVEVVNQPIGGNRLVYLSAPAPPSALSESNSRRAPRIF